MSYKARWSEVEHATRRRQILSFESSRTFRTTSPLLHFHALPAYAYRIHLRACVSYDNPHLSSNQPTWVTSTTSSSDGPEHEVPACIDLQESRASVRCFETRDRGSSTRLLGYCSHSNLSWETRMLTHKYRDFADVAVRHSFSPLARVSCRVVQMLFALRGWQHRDVYKLHLAVSRCVYSFC